MAGFYTNHLKSNNAQKCAPIIEDAFSKAITLDGKATVVEVNLKAPNAAQDILSAGYAVLRDHPEHFYYNTSLSATSDGVRACLSTNLLYSPQKIAQYKENISNEVARIRSLMNPMWTKWDKEKFIFEYLQSTVEYVDDGKNERYNIIGALLEHKAVCEGISKAFAVLCHSVGIPCIVVFSKTHMWNLVNINGILCNVDATYGTGSNMGINYTYFNTSDKYMDKEHVKELECIPKCEDDAQGYYTHIGTFFENERDLKSYLLKHLILMPRTAHVKLKTGNIEKVVESAIGLIPRSLEYSINHNANTAIIRTS